MSIAHFDSASEIHVNEESYLPSWELLKAKLLDLKKNNASIVFTNGCFDLVHTGHIHCLKEAKRLGTILVIGLNDDESVRRYKGPTRPIKPLFDRAIVLAAIRYVDFVVSFSEDTPKQLIEFLAPCIDVLVKGVDYINKPVAGGESVLKSGGKIVAIGWKNQHSTTTLTQRLKS